jgi:peptidyl-dipeptidase A
MSRLRIVAVLLLVGQIVFIGRLVAAEPAGTADARAKRFIERHEANVRPMEIEVNRLWWTANITGKEADFQKKQAAEEKLDLYLADPQRFAELKAVKLAGVSDRLLARQIAVLYLQYLEQQIPTELMKKMVARSNAVEQAFNVFRPKLGGKEITDNDVRKILIESRDSVRRRATWEASKQVAPAVAGELRALVALRNQAAHKLGFSDYFALRLYLGEQNEEQLFKLFDELEQLTREPFRQAKAEFDAALAVSYGITVDELRPWHYHDPFFQEVPVVEGTLPESVYRSLDIVAVCRKFYDGIGLPVDDVLQRSSLYEKPGKCPHAFCVDIDRAGDIRLLQNIVPNEEWLATMLHEAGHAVYSKFVGSGKGDSPHLPQRPAGGSAQMGTVPFSAPSLPYVLHTDAHPLCTEGVAMMFERFGHNVDWLLAMGAKIPEPERYRAAAARLQRHRLLIFARYCQVVVRFERELYRNPNQDLNRLWWNLAVKYQEIKRPEGRNQPDYAAKIHIVSSPVYYHNYMLGEMFASQVHHALIRAIGKGDRPHLLQQPAGGFTQMGPVPFSVAGMTYVGNRTAGEWMKQRVFAPGLSLNWNELTRHATGKELNAKAFAEDIETVK